MCNIFCLEAIRKIGQLFKRTPISLDTFGGVKLTKIIPSILLKSWQIWRNKVSKLLVNHGRWKSYKCLKQKEVPEKTQWLPTWSFQEDLEDPQNFEIYPNHPKSPSASWIFEPSMVPVACCFLKHLNLMKNMQTSNWIISSIFGVQQIQRIFEHHLHSGALRVVNEDISPQ